MLEKYKKDLIAFVKQMEGIDIRFDIDHNEMWLAQVFSTKTSESVAIRVNSTPAFGTSIAIFGNDEDLNLDLSDKNFKMVIEQMTKQISDGHYMQLYDTKGNKSFVLEWCKSMHIDSNVVLEKFKESFEPEIQNETAKIVYHDFLGQNPITLVKKNNQFVVCGTND